MSLLESPVWTDRNKASSALVGLTEDRNPDLLGALRPQLPALAEMARWRSRDHAQAAFLILGRMGGLTDLTAAAAWREGDADRVIRAACQRRP